MSSIYSVQKHELLSHRCHRTLSLYNLPPIPVRGSFGSAFAFVSFSPEINSRLHVEERSPRTFLSDFCQELLSELEKQVSFAENAHALFVELEGRLSSVALRLAFDEAELRNERTDVLAAFWTSMGGNRSRLGRVIQQLGEIQELSACQKTASDKLQATEQVCYFV